MNLPKEIEQFVNNLVPTDVGVDNVGDYVVRYEGFTDECNDGHDDNSIDDVYADAYQDFDNRQGQEAMVRGVAYDELGCDNNPVLYSVYKNINEAVNPDKMTGDEMRELLDKKHAWDDGIHNPEFINDVRRHNWVLINNYPLAKLGSVEDPYDRIIDTDDDYAMRYFPMIEENLNTSTLTLDQMLSYLEKAMKEKHHQDWLGWVGQNKIFKLKTIPIDSVSPADGWRGDQNKIDNMAKSDLNNAPLIVVHKNGAIIDGNHRHQALKKQGAQTVKAYVGENFKDGKKKGKSRPGRVKRAGASCKGSVTSLRAKAKKYSGERGKMYHWCANMKGGKKKKK